MELKSKERRSRKRKSRSSFADSDERERDRESRNLFRMHYLYIPKRDLLFWYIILIWIIYKFHIYIIYVRECIIKIATKERRNRRHMWRTDTCACHAARLRVRRWNWKDGWTFGFETAVLGAFQFSVPLMILFGGPAKLQTLLITANWVEPLDLKSEI